MFVSEILTKYGKEMIDLMTMLRSSIHILVPDYRSIGFICNQKSELK